MRATEPLDELTWQELRGMLDEEIGRLAEKYRAPWCFATLREKVTTRPLGNWAGPRVR